MILIHYCHSCGAKNPYINGVKPKFCSSCGEALEPAAKVKSNSSSSSSASSRDQRQDNDRNSSRGSSGGWKDEWKGKSYAGNNDDDADLDEVMRGLKRETGVTIEKAKMLTVGSLKEMESFDGRTDAPQGDKDLAGTRAEILKNLGVSNS